MNDTETGRPAASRKGRALRILLVVSLALNLLVLGVLAGGLWTGARHERTSSVSDLRALIMAMPDDTRRDLRVAVRARQAEQSALDRDARRARDAARRDEISELLRAPEFDAQAFLALLDSERAERARRTEWLHDAIAAHIATLDGDARATIADRLDARAARRAPWR
ncbi:MAG: putative integral membrane protein [Rhodobacteraceae bacterium HLUCCA12]|nr:MAG: putative integral membrane protein [Rhodobacteraceae bacterium HLUCCA12]